jgi:hypothetical protein
MTTSTAQMTLTHHRPFCPLMEGRDHDEYLTWRDRMVVRTRLLKEGDVE